MEYFEFQRPPGAVPCSDDGCPCPDTMIQKGEGYLYITPEVVKWRKEAPTLKELENLLLNMKEKMGAFVMLGHGVMTPILICEEAAKRRNLNLQIASEDAKYWWKTGLVPLRVTQMAGEEETINSFTEKKEIEKSNCFIATSCYGTSDCYEINELRRFRDDKLLSTRFGKLFVKYYYRFSPHLAHYLYNKPKHRKVVMLYMLNPIVYIIEKYYRK